MVAKVCLALTVATACFNWIKAIKAIFLYLDLSNQSTLKFSLHAISVTSFKTFIITHQQTGKKLTSKDMASYSYISLYLSVCQKQSKINWLKLSEHGEK